ncbi:MAG: hypothetical protein JO215_03675 [Ktedonobacteraceae bacterium]|nr:hypothetical protein [Ktedonobacteraceae bacterium]
MANSNSRAIFYAAIVVAIIAVLLCVFYMVPGVYHPLAFSGDPSSAHPKHSIAFGLLAVLAIIGALVTRPKSVN